jgi:hypothetical protein
MADNGRPVETRAVHRGREVSDVGCQAERPVPC